MRRTSLCAVLILTAAVGAILMRLPDLDRRPMHPDEANQAFKAGILYDQGVYRYDPGEHHGPTLYYLTLPALWLGGAHDYSQSNETHYRAVTVVFGVGLVMLLLLLADGLGWEAAVSAAFLTALSPAMVFYSRYYIQEILLVFFTFAAIAAAWRYRQTQKVRWLILTGAALSLMHATKETAIICWAAMLAAMIVTVAWGRREKKAAGAGTKSRPRVRAGHFLLSAAAAVSVSVFLYSSFLANLSGPPDSVAAYLTYLKRGGGESVHLQPWYHYINMLIWSRYDSGPVWSEGLIVGLAAVGLAASFLHKGIAAGHLPLVRFLAVYTLALTVIYSVVPYKTPWNLLGPLHGMILLAGVGAVVLVRALRSAPLRILACAVLAAAACHLGWQAYLGSCVFHADWHNPYVYAQTDVSVVRVAQKIEGIAALDEKGHDLIVKVIAPSHWPLPWYLRRFHHVGYWYEMPQDPNADVVILSPDLEDAFLTRIRRAYAQPDCFYLRSSEPGVPLLLYVNWGLNEKWRILGAGADGAAGR